MRKDIHTIIMLIMIATLMTFNVEGSLGKIKIAVSIGVLKNIVEEIGGNRVEVFSIVPPNVEPHTFTITPQVIYQASTARLIVIDGHMDWEMKLVEQVANAKGMKQSDISINLMDYADKMTILEIPSWTGVSGRNYHGYWILPENVMVMAEAIKNKLSEIDPEGVGYYEENFAKLRGEIDALKREIMNLRGKTSGVKAVLAFLAEQYVAYMFGLEIASILTIEEGGSPTPKTMETAYNTLKEGGIIIASDVSSKMPVYNTVQELSKQTGAPIIEVMITMERGYIPITMYNIGVISGMLLNRSIKHTSTQTSQEIPWVITVMLGITVAIESAYIYKIRRRM
jgi:ABC-type Zn uptake system ZnuABC Zn-binding protein ZnuA